MRILFAIALLIMISGMPGLMQGADAPAPEAPAAPAPETTNAVADQMAIPSALYEQKYLSLQLDLVFFTPITGLPPYTINDPNTNGTQEGSLVTPTYDQDNNIRPVLQYNCTDTNTLFEINYLRMAQGNDFGLARIGLAGNQHYWTTLANPNASADRADSVDGRVSLTYIELNVLARYSIRRTSTINYFVDWGFRWAQIRQHLKVNYRNTSGSGEDEIVDIRSAVNAGGMTLGAGLEYDIFSWLKLHGRFGAALLQGSLSGSYSEVDGTGFTYSNYTGTQNTLIPVLETAVGLDCNPDFRLPYAGLVIFHLGYEMKNYFQVTDLNTLVDDVNDGTMVHNRTSFGTAGYTLGVQFVWTLN